jgi:uncharacterized protein YndB with AHSA1/START domain
MTSTNARLSQAPVRLERFYDDAAIADLWYLWTTKDGFETWWGPNGFKVVVHKLEACAGGELLYDMVAVREQEIEALKRMNMAPSHATRGRFVQLTPLRSLEIVHAIDFIPGVSPYEHLIRTEFFSKGKGAGMVINVEPHHDPHWTRQAVMGMESQLTKVPAILAAGLTRTSKPTS